MASWNVVYRDDAIRPPPPSVLADDPFICALQRLEAHAERPKVLLIDHDPGAHEMFGPAFRRADLDLFGATCGAEAMLIAMDTPCDFWIVELNLPDMSAIELMRAVRARGAAVQWMLLSGLLSVPITVEAMNLGACDVVEKPVDADDLVATTKRHLAGAALRRGVVVVLNDAADYSRHPGSVAVRWAVHVLRACSSREDPKTLEHWAKCAGVSYTSLCESCRLIRIRPHDARDFTRTLRAKIHALAQQCPTDVLLDVGDRRTLRSLVERAGPSFLDNSDQSLLRFVATQHFIDPQSVGIHAIVQQLVRAGGLPTGAALEEWSSAAAESLAVRKS